MGQDFDGIARAAAAWLGLPAPEWMRMGSQGFAGRTSREPLPIVVRVAAVRQKLIAGKVCHQVVLSYVALAPDGAPHAWSTDMSGDGHFGGSTHVTFYGPAGAPLLVPDDQIKAIAAATKAFKALKSP